MSKHFGMANTKFLGMFLSWLSHCQETVRSQGKTCPYLTVPATVTRGETLNPFMKPVPIFKTCMS